MLIIIIFTILIVLTLGFIIWYYKYVYFYRDPKRIPPKGENIILSPADGVIVYIKKIKDGKLISNKLGQKIKVSEITKVPDFYNYNKEGWLIGIYMKPNDVHFNYSPCHGRVEKIIYTKSKFNLPMIDVWEYIKIIFLHKIVNFLDKKFHWQNERNTIFLKNKNLKIVLVEIADKFVNKIDCFVKEGEKILSGQKISFIHRGSQVDLLIYKKELDFKIKVGDQVFGAKTILANYK